jgi:hypothetical protein
MTVTPRRGAVVFRHYVTAFDISVLGIVYATQALVSKNILTARGYDLPSLDRL